MPDDTGWPTHEAIRALAVDRGLRARLVRHAYSRCRSVTDSQDIVQAIKKVLEGASPWRPDKCPNLIDHLGSVINTVAWNRAHSASARRDRPLRPEQVARMVDGAPNPERLLSDREEARELVLLVERCMVALRLRLQGDETALVVLDLFEHGVDRADEQAQAANRTREEIDKARRRVSYHADVVMRAQREGGGDIARAVAP